jgi:hypothetical protein
MNQEDLRTQRAAWQKEVSAYLDAHGIQSQLGTDELEFAVIAVWKCEEQAIRNLAAELVAWTEGRNVRIFGLNQMLEGRQPQVAARLFCIPILIGSKDPRHWVQEVALVVRAKNNDEPEAKLAASLDEIVSLYKPAFLNSYENYCDQQR